MYSQQKDCSTSVWSSCVTESHKLCCCAAADDCKVYVVNMHICLNQRESVTAAAHAHLKQLQLGTGPLLVVHEW